MRALDKIPRRRTRATLVSLRGLSSAHQRRFRLLVDEYGIEDRAGQEVLVCGLRSLMQAEACETAIAADGLTLRDRFGQVRSHPLLPAARDHRAAWQAALRQLNFEIGTPPKLGRPLES